MMWKPAPGFEGWYEVSDTGLMRRVHPGTRTRVGRLLAQTPSSNGYVVARLFVEGVGYTRAVHRLVAEAFCGRPTAESFLVRHLDGDPLNNRAENLRWGTPKENAADTKRHRAQRGAAQLVVNH